MTYTFDDVELNGGKFKTIPTRTYKIVCDICFDDKNRAIADLLEVYLYSRPEPLMSDKPGTVNLIAPPGEPTILSANERDRLMTYAEEHAPEPPEDRAIPDKDDEAPRVHPVFEPILAMVAPKA